MFKKLFGPKKYEAQGEPAALDELKTAILEFFPMEGEINRHLSITESEKTHAGFAAVWEFYMRDLDSEGYKSNYLLTHTVLVDIRPDEKAVYFKSKHFARTKRIPKGETIYEPWFAQVGIGKLDDLKVEASKKVKKFSSKKRLEPIAEKIASMGWDAYI